MFNFFDIFGIQRNKQSNSFSIESVVADIQTKVEKLRELSTLHATQAEKYIQQSNDSQIHGAQKVRELESKIEDVKMETEAAVAEAEFYAGEQSDLSVKASKLAANFENLLK